MLGGTTTPIANWEAGRIEAPIEIVDYDASWPSAFKKEQRALSEVVAPWLVGAIEHVGSTAVPGLAAKPVIDLMAPIETLEISRPAIQVLVQFGYAYFPYRSDVMHWFCKPSPAFRTHHLNLVPFRSTLWQERISFRDALRQDSELVAEYASLKQALALEYKFDREAYTDAKGPFIHGVLSRIQGGRGAA